MKKYQCIDKDSCDLLWSIEHTSNTVFNQIMEFSEDNPLKLKRKFNSIIITRQDGFRCSIPIQKISHFLFFR